MITNLFRVLILFLPIILLAVPVYHAMGNESSDVSIIIKQYRITNDTKMQHDPVIFGDKICWEGDSSLGIYYNIQDKQKYLFGEEGGFQDYDVFGDYIVWADETIVPQIPYELIPVLTQRAAIYCGRGQCFF